MATAVPRISYTCAPKRPRWGHKLGFHLLDLLYFVLFDGDCLLFLFMTYDNYRLQDCCWCSRPSNPENALPLMMAVAVASLISDSTASRHGRFLKS